MTTEAQRISRCAGRPDEGARRGRQLTGRRSSEFPGRRRPVLGKWFVRLGIRRPAPTQRMLRSIISSAAPPGVARYGLPHQAAPPHRSAGYSRRALLEDALFGDLSGENDAATTHPAQQIVHRRRVEALWRTFVETGNPAGNKRLHEVRSLPVQRRGDDGIAIGGEVAVVVVDVDDVDIAAFARAPVRSASGSAMSLTLPASLPASSCR